MKKNNANTAHSDISENLVLSNNQINKRRHTWRYWKISFTGERGTERKKECTHIHILLPSPRKSNNITALP